MNWRHYLIPICFLFVGQAAPGFAAANSQDDPLMPLVNRLELEKYKTTIKGLTQFGDRRQGTDRNRPEIDWIEAQLKSYGCTNTERIRYDYSPATPPGRRAQPVLCVPEAFEFQPV
jgi:hypothetical protein